MITVRILHLEATVTDKTFFSVVWKRGPHSDETSVFSVEGSSTGGIAQINETFSKKSQIYFDSKTGKYLSKMVILDNFDRYNLVCV